MTTVRVQRMTIQTEAGDPGQAHRLGRRVAELLGEAIAADPGLARRTAAAGVRVDVENPEGQSVERAAAEIVRRLRARLS